MKERAAGVCAHFIRAEQGKATGGVFQEACVSEVELVVEGVRDVARGAQPCE